MKDYFKVKKFDGVNNPRKDYGNTPNGFQKLSGHILIKVFGY